MKSFLIFIAVTISFHLNAQSIYLGLKTGMTQDEAKKEFKNNKESYTNIDLGNGFIWRLYQQNFIYDNGGLVGVLFSPKGSALGLSYQNTISYLEFTRKFFTSKDYQLFYEPEYWNAPYNFKSKYGLLMINPDSTTVIQLYPWIQTLNNSTVFNAYLKLLNYNWFMKAYKQESEDVKQKQDNTGF